MAATLRGVALKLSRIITNIQTFKTVSAFAEYQDHWEVVYPTLQTHPLVSMVTFSNFTTVTYYGCKVKWAPEHARAIAIRKWLCKTIRFYSTNGREYTRVY